MGRFALLLLFATGIFLFSFHAANADDIQMLPPLDFSGHVCSGTNAGILYWDGVTQMKCVPGVSGNVSGQIGIGMSPTAAFTLLADSPISTTAEWSPSILKITPGGDDNQALYMSYDSTADLGFIEASKAGLFTSIVLQPRGGNVGIGTTTTPNSSLDLSNRTDAVSMPSGSTAQRPASATPGMTRYNVDRKELEYWDGLNWRKMNGSIETGWQACVMNAGNEAQTSLGIAYYSQTFSYTALGQSPSHVEILARERSTGRIITMSPMLAYGYGNSDGLTYAGFLYVELRDGRITAWLINQNPPEGGKVADLFDGVGMHALFCADTDFKAIISP